MRVGIIGTNWGRMHLGAFRAAGAHVVGVCAQDLPRACAVAQSEGLAFATDDVAALCDAVEVVVVASPDALHHAHVQTALRLGRHVLCEKPLTVTLREAEALCVLAASSGRRCAVNFPYRQLPPLLALRQWLPPVRELEVVLRSSFATASGSSADLGGLSHLIDAVLWLCRDEPESVQASIVGGSVTLTLRTRARRSLTLVHRLTAEPGIHGSWSFAGDGFEAGFFAGYQPAAGGWCVSAPRGWVDGTWRDLAPRLDPQPGQREPWAEAHVATARAFLAGELHLLASFRDGAQVQAVLDAALRSSTNGRRERVEPVP